MSLNTEIVDRLRRTFVEDEKITEVFGSRKTFSLMKLIASVAETVDNPYSDEPKKDWTEDPYLYEQVVQAANLILGMMRPPGPVPEEGRPYLQGLGKAARKLQQIWETAPTASFDRYGRRLPGSERVARIKTELGRAQTEAIIKADLGEMAERIPLNVETMESSQLQRIAGLTKDGAPSAKRMTKGKRK